MSIDLPLTSPYLNAAGMLGFAPHGVWNWQQPQGAFVTAPISRHARSAAENRTATTRHGLALLHSGLPNPGLRVAIRQYGHRWADATLPIWVHIIPSQAGEAIEMVRVLEDVEGVAAVEMSLPDNTPADTWFEVLKGVGGSRLPLILSLSITCATVSWLETIGEAGAAAINVTAPRGMMDGGSGRLYGPALLPLAHQALNCATSAGVPVIVSSGIFTIQDASELLQHGAAAVGLDTILWG